MHTLALCKSAALSCDACYASGNTVTVKPQQLPAHFWLLQLCEVEFTISQQQQQQLTYSAKAHNNESTALIRAALTPDGSRAYQINGKNKTATEVKVGHLCLDR
eukprot:1142912-Pelagomonas_calceolata.AAC.22